MLETWLWDIDTLGFAEIPRVFGEREVDDLLDQLQRAFQAATDRRDLLRARDGSIYGARNLLRVMPETTRIWQIAPLTDLLERVLGSRFGLVRGLYFDKPPEHSWSLSWHRDLTIAVRDNRLATQQFRNPTTKAGVPHIEASTEVLERMLTLRIHLDDVTDSNGPLKVIVGSHRTDDAADCTAGGIRTILAKRGDVLAMRPRLSHSSIATQAGSPQHRRILHLEFSADQALPDGFAWHDFISAERVD